jgi:hypothetical protein
MSEKDSLENNKADLQAIIAKSILGAIPYCGPFLSELANNIIPNQRIDRIAKYVQKLELKISQIPIETINLLMNNDEFIDLIEEGYIQASRAISDERREYIAAIVANGIQEDTIKLYESKYLLKILSELNDIEIIWLRFYLFPTINGDIEYRERHKKVLKPKFGYINADNEALTDAAIQISYKEHLARLKLIDHKIKIDSSTNMPEYDVNTGHPKRHYTTITFLGRLLLKQTGIIEDINIR